MTITGGIYFLGAYRPAYFEADTIDACRAMLLKAARPMFARERGRELRAWLIARINEGAAAIARGNCTAWSADHNDRGVCFAKRPHDPFLDRATAELPPCPGLDYSGAVNA
jgi:hypothetical protein